MRCKEVQKKIQTFTKHSIDDGNDYKKNCVEGIIGTRDHKGSIPTSKRGALKNEKNTKPTQNRLWSASCWKKQVRNCTQGGNVNKWMLDCDIPVVISYGIPLQHQKDNQHSK